LAGMVPLLSGIGDGLSPEKWVAVKGDGPFPCRRLGAACNGNSARARDAVRTVVCGRA
jgi:hypothetical protein